MIRQLIFISAALATQLTTATLAFQPASIWHVTANKPLSISVVSRTAPNSGSSLGALGVMTPGHALATLSVDTTAPFISSFKLNNASVSAGDFASSTPLISASISESGAGLATWNITILDASNAPVQSHSGHGNGITGAALTVSWNVATTLANGTYTVHISAYDLAGNTTSFSSPLFSIASFSLSKPLNSPNPFNPNKSSTFIEYQLSADAHISLYIYSISGEKLWSKVIQAGDSGGTLGYNSVAWNGKNDFGEIVANGPYIAYIFAESNGQKKTAKVKILVLK